jgi:signal transduction histidine kinase
MIAMALVGWQAVKGTHDLSEKVKSIYMDELLPLRTIATADSGLIAWNRAILNHILAEDVDKMEQYEQTINRHRDRVSEALRSLLGMKNLLKQEEELVKEIQERFSYAVPIENRLVAVSREGMSRDAQVILHGELRPLVDQMGKDMDSFLSIQENLILEAERTLEKRYRDDQRKILLTMGSVFLLSLIISLVMSAAIARAIRRLVKGTREFGRGNLNYRIEVGSGDEIGELAAALNLMAAERKSAEDSLLDSSEKLKLFAYSVVHDLKSPAIGIHGLTNLLHRRYRDVLDEQGRACCEQVLKASEQVVALVENVNTYIAAKEIPLKVEEIDFREILQMVKEEFSTQLSIRQINYSWPEIEEHIKADRLSLLRVFRNLVDNALKYGGDQLSKITIQYEESEDFHVLSVTDNGVGVKTEDSEKLFALFQRQETSRGVEGTGLGLAIVKEIAERHRGKVWVEPGLQAGVTFHVTISKKL